MRNIICHAIKHQLILELTYGGGKRIVKPYIYGKSKHGRELLSAYQIEGHSRSNKPTGWKTFICNGITNLQPTSLTFSELESDYNRHDPHFHKIHCQI